jgi:hypothetical protein
MMSKVDAAGKINWLHVLPKQQREVIRTGSSGGPAVGVSMSFSFFTSGFNWPFYAGYGILPGNNSGNLIFNDTKRNDNVLQLGQKVKSISSFRRSTYYAITLNTLTGNYTRTALFDNVSVPTAMPRLGSVLGNELYIVGKEDRIFGKTKIAVAKLAIK